MYIHIITKMKNRKLLFIDGLIVNNGDAHAWPELYIDKVGWVALDIAPKENLDGEPPPVDEDMMESLIELARDVENKSFREPIDWEAFWEKWRPIIVFWVVLISILTLGLHYLYKIYRRVRPKWKLSPLVIYIASIDQLSEIGLRRFYGESRESFARRVSEKVPAFSEITNGHLAEAKL